MEWDRAESAARRVLAMKTRSATRNRAVDIARVAPGLKRVFKDLDERDELNRNWETHPSLVRLVRGGSETLAVPILGLDAPYQPVLDDPVGHVQRAAQAGKVMLLVKGAKQFTPAEMDVVDYNILPADQAAMRADAQQGLSARLARVQADKAAQRDAFVWYELGKFAYRNRLDDQVVKHLEKAVDLDPFLARSVREANAGILFGSLVAHMKNGNKAQAAAFMASIERRFKDTEQGKQARLYYQGETSKLVELAKEAARREKEEAEARKRELAERARQKGDEAVAKQIEEAPAEEPAEPAGDDSGPVAAEIATARELRDKGAKLLGEAVNMPATDARNHKYSEAAKTLAKAKASYAAYLEKNPTDSSAEAEFIETNKMWFTANKMKTL
jgi:hypothetical protein